MKQRIINTIKKTHLGKLMTEDSQVRTVLFSACSMGWNVIYALLNGVLAIIYGSLWFTMLFLYYLVLGMMRLSVVSYDRNSRDNRRRKTVELTLGFTMIALALCITGVIYFRIADHRVTKHDNIMMITIATVTFAMVTSTIVSTVKAHKRQSDTLIMLRNISCAGAVGSMLSLERSMLATFGNISDSSSFTMEVISGAGAFVLILLIGISMIVRACKKTT